MGVRVFLKGPTSQQSLTSLGGVVCSICLEAEDLVEGSSGLERFCGNTVRKGKVPKPHCSPQASLGCHGCPFSGPSQSASRGQGLK